MMKFFKKTKEVIRQSLVSEVDVIEEIHESFEGAADAALTEAKKILSASINESDKEYGEKLLQLGFIKTELATKVSGDVAEKGRARRRAETVMHWQVKYPQYKLIFLDQVQAICAKYGLVLGQVWRYKGTVPNKNIDEMVRFKIDEADHLYLDRGYRNGIYGITKNATRQATAYDGAGPDGILNNERCGFFICAPQKDMWMEDSHVINGIISPKDPIVLMPIEEQGRAFLIVSKWGLEGQDKSLVNEISN